MNNLITTAYLIYIPVTLGLTYYVAQTLFKHGKIFMLDIFRGRENIAEATNKLMQVGFYLLNIGFALYYVKIPQNNYKNPLDTYQELVETLSYKVGTFAIYLGIMLFINLFLFFRGKKASKRNTTIKPNTFFDAEKPNNT